MQLYFNAPIIPNKPFGKLPNPFYICLTKTKYYGKTKITVSIKVPDLLGSQGLGETNSRGSKK